MKKIIIICGLVLGVSFAMMLIVFFLYSQVNYVNLVNKKVSISEDDLAVLIIDKEDNVVFSYSIDEWRSGASLVWEDYFVEPLVIDGDKLRPNDFSKFVAVSAFPEGTKTIVFAVFSDNNKDVSLFWTLNIDTKKLSLVGDVNLGTIGNIIWSPDGVYFAYLLNTRDVGGKYITVDNVKTREKEFTLSKSHVLELLTIDDENYSPEFRMMKWDDDGERLSFTTNGVSEETSIRWSVGYNGEDLKVEN